jgi:hypothetical protein
VVIAEAQSVGVVVVVEARAFTLFERDEREVLKVPRQLVVLVQISPVVVKFPFSSI